MTVFELEARHLHDTEKAKKILHPAQVGDSNSPMTPEERLYFDLVILTTIWYWNSVTSQSFSDN